MTDRLRALRSLLRVRQLESRNALAAVEAELGALRHTEAMLGEKLAGIRRDLAAAWVEDGTVRGDQWRAAAEFRCGLRIEEQVLAESLCRVCAERLERERASLQHYRVVESSTRTLRRLAGKAQDRER
jgi:hypothetical protein